MCEDVGSASDPEVDVHILVGMCAPLIALTAALSSIKPASAA